MPGAAPRAQEAPILAGMPDALRRELWLANDVAYKRAVTVFARKRAAFQNRTGTEPLPDFSRETPVETLRAPMVSARPNRDWIDRVRQISSVFASSTELYSSE